MTRPRWKDEPESNGIGIEVVTEFEDVPPISGSESGLHDLIVNLILNAVDAMPGGGTITLASKGHNHGVLVTAKDTGVGMDEETRRRVFEPFFTTKPDIGSGLGLSTAYTAVTGWGGEMSVESAPGVGTTFSVWLPSWTESEAHTQHAEGSRPEASGPARLLIIEDDRGVCDFLSRLLGSDHDVDVVADGPGAMDRFVPGRYDVALIDVGIPGMTGDGVARKMRQADPSVPIIVRHLPPLSLL